MYCTEAARQSQEALLWGALIVNCGNVAGELMQLCEDLEQIISNTEKEVITLPKVIIIDLLKVLPHKTLIAFTLN